MKLSKYKVNKIKNNFYIKYFMIKAGNDSKKIKKDLSKIITQVKDL